MEKQIGSRRGQAGFTLMELMVVVVIIAMIAMFALPKVTKNIAKTKVTDSINALNAAATQIEGKCAVDRAWTVTQDFVNNTLSIAPNGYNKPAISVTTCGNFSMTMGPATGEALPTMCIKRQDTGAFLFNSSGCYAEISSDDIPIPSARMGTCP